ARTRSPKLRFGIADMRTDNLDELRRAFAEEVERFWSLASSERRALRDRLVRLLPEDLALDVVAAYEEATRRSSGELGSRASEHGPRPPSRASTQAPTAADTLSAVEGAFNTDEPLEDAEKRFLAELARLAVKAMLGASCSGLPTMGTHTNGKEDKT
ncbi:MAG: hypothetical protein KIS78_33765, partial [Labilithrix sp.]|nr:hypothetical protein [Labilithrix sp.]